MEGDEYEFVDKEWTVTSINQNMKLYRFDPFNGAEILQFYNDMKNRKIGHRCSCCDHCDLFCQDRAYPGSQHRGGGWCWHPADIPTPWVICMQACDGCIKKVCEFHFIMRMLAEHYKLPRDIRIHIARYVSHPCKVICDTYRPGGIDSSSYFEC